MPRSNHLSNCQLRHPVRCCTLLFCLLLAVVGCGNLAGPDYERPAAAVKADWSAETLAVDEVIREDWWKSFANPQLNDLIEKALANNSDLKVLAARITQAEAAIGQANATRLPTVDAALGARLQGSQGADSVTQQSYASAVGWELDIWGKLKKGVDAQKAALRASEADWRAGYLELVTAVANTYFQAAQYDEQISVQEAALLQGTEILTIYQSLYREGMIPKTQLVQQQAEINQLQKDLIELQRLRQLATNALATLTGTPAGELYLPQQNLRETQLPIEVPAGLPSDLLSRRPDIIAAEYRVLQVHHLQGQARLAQLPSIRLTSNFGNTSSALSDLLTGWNFGLTPVTSIPIFDPNVRARVRVSEAQALVAEEEYRRTVINAFEEVENALVNLASRKLQREEQIEREVKLKMVAEQVRAQLQEGMVSQLQVFESERSLLAARLASLDDHRQMLSDTVVLYKALGGGWPAEVVE